MKEGERERESELDGLKLHMSYEGLKRERERRQFQRPVEVNFA